MQQIVYREISLDMLEEVRPLWESLNQHHAQHSHYFEQHFRHNTFEKRCKKLLECQHTRVDIAENSRTSEAVAYCITTVSQDNVGEIDSLFIKPPYRKKGIGDVLMAVALAWLQGKKVKRTIIGVAQGNEAALGFYQRFGFRPRMVILEEAGKSLSSEPGS